MRLLQCLTCTTLDELPDYEGPPEGDILLTELCETRHRHPNGEPHMGNLHTIDDKLWERLKENHELERQIWGEKFAIAELRNTYLEDAGVCYNRHHRPPEGCPDYQRASKRIGTPGKYRGTNPVFLCSWCPVHTFVVTEIRRKGGMYRD